MKKFTAILFVFLMMIILMGAMTYQRTTIDTLITYVYNSFAGVGGGSPTQDQLAYYATTTSLGSVASFDIGLLEDKVLVGNSSNVAAAVSTAPTNYYSSSTITGWSSSSGKIDYMVVGRYVTVNFFINGTSNATTVSFTLPTALTNQAASSSDAYSVIAVRDNGSRQAAPGYCSLGAGSYTVNCFKSITATSGDWTSSAGKFIIGTISYWTD